MEVTYSEFVKELCKDYNIDINKDHRTYYSQFPIKNGKRRFKGFYNSIIVDREGGEFPYMLTRDIRNDEKLKEFHYIKTPTHKSLKEILEEGGIHLKSEPCKICEGGGWYSKGVRYYYKDMTVEI